MPLTERHTRKPRLFGSPARRLAGIGAMLLALAAQLAGAQEFDEGLQLRDATGTWRNSAALETDVAFNVDGLIAHVQVRQRYINDSTEWLEGRYLLPLPEDAAVGALRIRAGNRVIEGVVREKEAARASYEAAAAAGQRAALVEQNRPNLFRTALANIGPGEAVTVEIEYWQGVDFADGEFSLVLPLTLVPRYGASSQEPGATAVPASAVAKSEDVALEPVVSLRVALDPGVALEQVHSPTHAITVQAEGARYDIQLSDLAVRADRSFELRWRPQASEQPQRAVFYEQLDGQTYAYAMLLPPTRPVAALPRELVLVIDTSGSMHGQALEQARGALVEALARLRPQDRFNLVQFDSNSSQLFAQARPATPDALDQATHWLAGLRATGGTRMGPALHLALAGDPPPGFVRQVVFATDAGVGNERELFDQIERELGQARLFPVGIGSAPNGWFLRRAAELGRGSHVTIRSINQVQQEMQRLFDRLDRPALGDVAVHWPAGVQATRAKLPDLYHGEPLLAIARLPALQGQVQASGWHADGVWRSQLDLAEARPARGVARLFARDAIQSLEDAIRQGRPEDEIRPQIVELALQHGLVTRFTSLVAIERTPQRPQDAALASTRFDNPLPAAGEDLLAFAQGATGARSALGWALALALLALALWRPRADENKEVK